MTNNETSSARARDEIEREIEIVRNRDAKTVQFAEAEGYRWADEKSRADATCQCGYKGAIIRSEWMLPDAVERIELRACTNCSDDCEEIWRDKDGGFVAQFDDDDTYLGGRRGKPLPRKATP